MYYGNSCVTASTENKTGVWNTNYKAVYHLSQSPAGTVLDSTSNNNDLSDANSVALNSSGVFAGAASFAAASSQTLSITDAAQTGLDVTGTPHPGSLDKTGDNNSSRFIPYHR